MILVHSIPLYWGVEKDAVDKSFWTRATVEEALPPYRYSIWGIRVRLSPWHWLHIGVCRYKTTLTPWGLEVSPDQIGAWGRKSDDGPEEETVDPTDAGALTVRSIRSGRSSRPAGSDDDAQRGAVPGAEPFGTGPGVGAGGA